MSIKLTAADTTMGSTFTKPGVEKNLEFLYIGYRENLSSFYHNKTNILYIDNKVLSFYPDAPSLVHPYLLTRNNDEKILFSDIRLFINKRESDKTNTLVSNNPTELAFTTLRTQLNALWIDGKQDNLRRDLLLSNKVFAGWISDTITKRFGLNPEDQLAIFVIAHFYYKTLFFKESVFDEETKLEFSYHTIKDSRLPAKFVLGIFDQIGEMGGIGDFIDNVKNIVTSRRISDLNLGTLITIIGTTWYGTNAKEILTVALEHPPTFAAIVAVAVTQRFYKKSSMYSLITKFGKSGEIEDYITNTMRLVEPSGD